MQNMDYYYDFSGQKFGYPLSLSINSFERVVFSRIQSLEICYVLKGEYEVITEHFSELLREHELALIAPDEIHKICCHGEDENVVLTIHIDFSKLPSSMAGHKNSFLSMICTEKRHKDMLDAFKRCMGQLIGLLQKKDYNLFELNKLMMELMAIASDSRKYSIEQLPLSSQHNENYMKAIRYIDHHYQEDLHLKDLAKTLNFSTSYTSKLFKKYNQIPFVKYLSYVRLRASLEALLEGKHTIEEIARDCGMPNAKAYTMAFKEMYGILPSSYRKQFVRNRKYDEEHRDQEMALDKKQLSLLAHLIQKDTYLYEDEKIVLMKQAEGYTMMMKKQADRFVVEKDRICLAFEE